MYLDIGLYDDGDEYVASDEVSEGRGLTPKAALIDYIEQVEERREEGW